MKKIIILIVFISILNSCETSSNDPELLGNWRTTVSTDTDELQFYNDSIIFYELGWRNFGKWKSKKSHIYIEVINRENQKTINNFEIEYKIVNDSLFIKRSHDSTFIYPVFVKVSNRFEHWLKILRINIKLKESEKTLISSGDDSLNKEVYIGYNKGELLVKIEDLFVDLENDAKYAAFTLMDLQSSEKEFENLKFVLIIDKNIPEYKVDSIKNILRQTPVKKIFRVYKNDSIDYHNLNWRGNMEWYGLFE